MSSIRTDANPTLRFSQDATLIPKREFLLYDRSSLSARMEDFDLRNCMMGPKVIDAFLDNQRGFRKTLGELKGLIILLREGQPILSRVLLRKWSQLHEFDAYMIYRQLPTLSLEQRALIDSTLMEMQSLILEAIRGAISGKPHGSTKPDREE